MKARGTIGNRPDGIRNVKGVRIFRAQGCIQQNRLWPFYCAACLFRKSLLSGLLFNVNSKVNVKLMYNLSENYSRGRWLTETLLISI